ncbi:MAG TPA: hypothetical protein GYA08_17755 [Chloroflexi bacterium]|nr:hypothetical protein [Chloroflexota bacterium]
MRRLTDSRKWSGILLGLLTVILILFLLASVVALMGLPFLFDAPGSTEIPALWTIFWGGLGLPIVIAVTIVLSWVLFLFKRNAAALLSTTLPLLYLLVLFVIFQLQGGVQA